MINSAVIENKISSIKKYLKILGRYKKYSQKEIEDNIDLKGAVERYLYLAVQATIDLAEAVISLKNFRKPTTLRENFYILKEEGIINKELTEKLAKMVGFRNIIVHDYEKLDYEIVYDVLKNRLKEIEKFLTEVKKKLRV
ncbi:MAG: DUF86 domain-containing protein [Candidatus Paceibacterales bacterium]